MILSRRFAGVWVWFVAIGCALAPGAGPAVQAALGDWEPTGLAEPVSELFTPASGALLAARQARAEAGSALGRTSARIFRSHDGGSSWEAIDLPTETGLVVVDPVDHAILFAHGSSGLHRSTDAGASWQKLTEREYALGDRLAISPADHGLLYSSRRPAETSFEMSRSRDGGDNWESVTTILPNARCAFTVDVLLPHAIDPASVSRMVHCTGPHGRGDRYEVSSNAGTSWTSHELPELPAGRYLPREMVGLAGANPERRYLRADIAVLTFDGSPPGGDRFLGSAILRSDGPNDWTTVLASGENTPPERNLTALAFDPKAPDILFAASGSGVQVSRNGGASWLDLGHQDLPRIHNLALGVDARNLYAATENGVYRLSLAP